MPHAQEFLNGFGLTPHALFASYELISATSTHEVIKKYQEYQYHIVLVFSSRSPIPDYPSLFHTVMATISQTHIIYGIRNPYQCTIDLPVNGDVIMNPEGTITFHLVGHSHRIV